MTSSLLANERRRIVGERKTAHWKEQGLVCSISVQTTVSKQQEFPTRLVFCSFRHMCQDSSLILLTKMVQGKKTPNNYKLANFPLLLKQSTNTCLVSKFYFCTFDLDVMLHHQHNDSLRKGLLTKKQKESEQNKRRELVYIKHRGKLKVGNSD